MLIPEIMHELIEKIIVHEADKSSGKSTQQIDIYFRFDVAVSSVGFKRDNGNREIWQKDCIIAILCDLI